MRSYRSVSTILLMVLGLASCKSSSTDSPTTGATLRVPGVGSTFVTHSYHFDSLGVKIDSTERYDTATVVATGVNYKGKTNVIQSQHGGFTNYETNGDISNYEDGGGKPGNPSGWEIIPITSKGKQTFTVYDTTTNGIHTSTWYSWTYTGTQTLTLAGRTFQAAVFLFENVTNGNAYYHETDYFDMETGAFLKSDIPKQSVYQYKEWGGIAEVISFDLK